MIVCYLLVPLMKRPIWTLHQSLCCLILAVLIPRYVLIPDCNIALDADTIFTAHSQLVSKALGVSWVIPLKQWLSWLNSLGSLINNTCPMLCYPSVLANF